MFNNVRPIIESNWGIIKMKVARLRNEKSLSTEAAVRWEKALPLISSIPKR